MISNRPRISIATVGLAALLLACWCLVADAETRRPVTVDDLLSLKYFDRQMEVSPNGETLAYVVNVEDSLWLVNTGQGIPRKVGQGIMPRWSPDGSRLAFYSTRSATLQLWVLDLKSGQATQITSLEGGINPDPLARFMGWIRDPLRYCWSPDGTKIVFTSQVKIEGTGKLQVAQSGTNRKLSPAGENDGNQGDDPLVLTTSSPPSWALSGVFRADYLGARYVKGKFTADGDPEAKGKLAPVLRNRIFVVDVASKAVAQLTKDDAGYFNPDWSPDGTKIVFVSTDARPLTGYGPGTSNIYVIDLRTGRKTDLTTGPGEKRLPYWSPDGKWIAYLGGGHFRVQSVFVVPSTGGSPVDITAPLDRYVQMFYWSVDSSSILASCIDGVSRPIVRVHVSSGRIQKLTKADAYYWPFSVSRAGRLVWVQSDGSSHEVIYVADSEGHNAHALLDLNPQIRQWALGHQEVVRWKNSRGEEIEGILIKPADYQEGETYPLIVDPYSSMANSFMGVPMLGNQALASKGYAVFLPNNRAPHIWPNPIKNEAYGQIARGPKGVDIMVDDVMTGIDTLVRRGIVDEKRMCLYGFSNGGGAVNLLVTRTSRFRCAVSAAGVLSDWALVFFLQPMGSTVPDLIGGMTPWEAPDAYIKLSPIYHVNEVTTPILLAVGDEDVGVLLPTLEMYYGLRYMRRDVTLLRYPKQGHGFTGAALKDYWQRANAFLDTYLKPL